MFFDASTGSESMLFRTMMIEYSIFFPMPLADRSSSAGSDGKRKRKGEREREKGRDRERERQRVRASETNLTNRCVQVRKQIHPDVHYWKEIWL